LIVSLLNARVIMFLAIIVADADVSFEPLVESHNGRCYFPSTWTENSQVCHFCPSLCTDKSGQCRLFSIHGISLFLLLFAHKRPRPFFLYMPHKNPLLPHKLSILQLNQATFDLPGSAIIRPTHKPS